MIIHFIPQWNEFKYTIISYAKLGSTILTGYLFFTALGMLFNVVVELTLFVDQLKIWALFSSHWNLWNEKFSPSTLHCSVRLRCLFNNFRLKIFRCDLNKCWFQGDYSQNRTWKHEKNAMVGRNKTFSTHKRAFRNRDRWTVELSLFLGTVMDFNTNAQCTSESCILLRPKNHSRYISAMDNTINVF